MEKKQNSVEWLIRIVQSCIAPNYIPKEIIKQAKAMHKDEIINAWLDESAIFDSEEKAENYYTKTFGGNNE